MAAKPAETPSPTRTWAPYSDNNRNQPLYPETLESEYLMLQLLAVLPAVSLGFKSTRSDVIESSRLYVLAPCAAVLVQSSKPFDLDNLET